MTVLPSCMGVETLDVSQRRPPRMYPGRRYPDGGGIQGTGRSLPGQPTRQEPALPPVDCCASATEESMKALTRTTSRRCRGNRSPKNLRFCDSTFGIDHHVGHCGAPMNLYAPLGSSPEIGRKHPYTIGDPADVATAQSMYPSIAPPMRKPRRESIGLADRLGHQVTSQQHVGVLVRTLSPVLKCCGMGRRQLGGATP